MTESVADLRPATEADSAACAGIYEHYVRTTPITFEIEPPTTEEIAERIRAANKTYAWLVLEQDGQVIGYAYATAYASRAAYQWSCETSVYLDKDFRGKGGGRRLYTALLDRLTQRGFRQAIASITTPNEPSRRLHQAFGFQEIGTFKDIGWKLGAWHDVLRMQKPLTTGTHPPTELR
ncbi:MAG: N-acetyltransferase family protein [Actinomycetota bacterium]|nr:N-acetyltransferase family protein [Actinomycetota bacterium]